MAEQQQPENDQLSTMEQLDYPNTVTVDSTVEYIYENLIGEGASGHVYLFRKKPIAEAPKKQGSGIYMMSKQQPKKQ